MRESDCPRHTGSMKPHPVLLGNWAAHLALCPCILAQI
jgi:hypothetical protein